MTATASKCTTSDIRVGDVIHHFGMRLLVDQEMREINSRSSGPVWVTSALIENWDQVAGYVGNLAEVDESGRRRWRIQGNTRAEWTRHR
jgi:hypothetical protein